MLLAVKFYSQCSDPYYTGFPEAWPWQTRPISDASECVEDETALTQEQVEAVIAEWQDEADAWWETKQASEIVLSEDEKWAGLSNALRGSEVFGHAYTAAKISVAIQMPMTLLIDALSNRNLADLRFAFNDLRSELAEVNADFNAEQLAWIQAQLEDWQFELIGFTLL